MTRTMLLALVFLGACGEPDWEDCSFRSALPAPMEVSAGGVVLELEDVEATWFHARLEVGNTASDIDCTVAVYQGHAVPPAAELPAQSPDISPPERLPSGAVLVGRANLAATRGDARDTLMYELGVDWGDLALEDGRVFAVTGCEEGVSQVTLEVDVETCEADAPRSGDLYTRRR